MEFISNSSWPVMIIYPYATICSASSLVQDSIYQTQVTSISMEAVSIIQACSSYIAFNTTATVTFFKNKLDYIISLYKIYLRFFITVIKSKALHWPTSSYTIWALLYLFDLFLFLFSHLLLYPKINGLLFLCLRVFKVSVS